MISNFKFQISNSRITALKLLFLLFLLLLYPKQVSAETMESDSYRILWGNFNMAAGIPDNSNYRVGLTGGQNSPGLYSSTGYKVRAGFWYYKTIPFSFTIDDLSIDFGTLTPGTPKTATSHLIVSSGGAGGYQVTASESSQLKTFTGAATIPDTSCNGSTDTCTVTAAKTWTNNSKYGFGYNLTGDDIPVDFSSIDHYRPFGLTAELIMSNSEVGKDRTATIKYKVNIGGAQAAGDYQNYIMFIATPTY